MKRLNFSQAVLTVSLALGMTALSTAQDAIPSNAAGTQNTNPQTRPDDPAKSNTNSDATRSTDSTRTKTQDKVMRETGTATDSTRNRAGESSAMLNPVDTRFVMTAAEGGKKEVALAKMAQEKASNQKVKDLAKKIEEDHMKANEELMEIAGRKGVSPPAADLTSDAKHKTMMDKMSNATGAGFDKAYLKAMTKDHKKDIAMFEKQTNQGMDSDVKAFAAKTLPALREHARMVEEAKSDVK